MSITMRLRNISPVASPEGRCEHNLHCKWSVSFIFIQSYQRILEWFGLEDHLLHSTLLWAGTPSTSLCFQLASTSTTLGVLIHTCCLNYAILGRKEKGVWSPEGWWAPRMWVEIFALALLQWGPPGPPLGRDTVVSGLAHHLPTCASAKLLGKSKQNQT